MSSPPYSGYVYLIECPQANRVKIGYSSNPEARLRKLQTGHPMPLYLWAWFEGNQSDEALLHAQLSAYGSHLEWFEDDWYVRHRVFSFAYANWLMRDRPLSPDGSIPPFAHGPIQRDPYYLREFYKRLREEIKIALLGLGRPPTWEKWAPAQHEYMTVLAPDHEEGDESDPSEWLWLKTRDQEHRTASVWQFMGEEDVETPSDAEQVEKQFQFRRTRYADTRECRGVRLTQPQKDDDHQ